jgi:uncharacterized BrkB/YihY/UPF0761 family membrane protein
MSQMILAGLTQLMGTLVGGTAFVAHALDILVSFSFVTALFAMIYKFLPDGSYSMARCMDRRCGDFISFHRRQIPDRDR